MGFAIVLVAALAAGDAFGQVHVDEGGRGFLEAPRGATSWAWDLDGDGTYDDCPDEDGCAFDAAGLDGPSDVLVPLWVDGAETTDTVFIDNVAPQFASEPQDSARVGGLYRYAPLAIDPAAELDAVGFELIDGAFPEGMAFDGVEVLWVPAEGQIGEHAVTLRVSDDDGGSSDQEWSITVAPNAPPFAPTPIFPDVSSCVDVESLSLVAANASDLDSDPLVYFFELDTDPGFRSIDLQASGPLPEGEYGETVWSPPRRPLGGSLFYWRVWVSDGIAESERVTSVFETCIDDTTDDYPYYGDEGDGYYYDDDSGDVGGPGLREGDGGCGCLPQPAEERRSTADAGLGLLAIVLVARLRGR